MLEFLRVPSKFALMTGQATKGKAMKGGQKLTKANGCRMLAEFVNRAAGISDRTWTTQDAKSRYEACVASYRRALKWSS
ncbi:hypothetical protein H257_04902 [Aphanomyces astaci]|uniref:Uncharacterized protein n=1 Tax=Aphanomyces astaci TaxID=112090 RepID=W4GS83_APHAT|nr:hypothetical protein H257_04902 [Aphanomyces astaci]ETV82191.1 hypothetical protein H257_04902 [Aphanomyces astaci]|eukprot:XP_009827860.1 hypothetical protein H257_04902 [Aphanomyces astaci]